MIIFLKSELAKCQREISTLQKNDYYSLAKSLERENTILANKNKELSAELIQLKKAFEKEVNTYREEIQSHENQRIKHQSTVEYLEKSKNKLETENIKLTKAIEEVKNELTTSKMYWSTTQEEDFKKSIENITQTMHDFIQNHNQQLSTIQEALTKNRDETIETKRHLSEEIKQINHKMDTLTNELADLKTQSPLKHASPLADNDVNHSDTFSYLDNKIQKVSTQSLYFEAELDKKLHLLDELEQKLIHLANEIDHPEV